MSKYYGAAKAGKSGGGKMARPKEAKAIGKRAATAKSAPSSKIEKRLKDKEL